MKRLRVLLVCLIVALPCWYPGQHVCCSEQSLSGSGPSVQDEDLHGHKQEKDSAQNKEVEEQSTQTSYDMGLETERAAGEKDAIVLHEQTVNQLEDEAKESSPELETSHVAFEPEVQSDHSQTLFESQTQDQDSGLESPTPEPSSDLGQISSDVETLTEDQAAPSSLDADPSPPADEAENAPTSQSAAQTHPSAVWVASARDELPVDSFVFAEYSQCRVIPPELATCENSPFGHPLRSEDEAATGDQNQTPDLELDVQSTPEVADGNRPELEDVLSGLDQEGNTSQLLHKEQMGDASVAKETDPSVPSKDDIPTFDEWKKQVMEVEKEKTQTLHTSTSSTSHSAKKVQKKFNNNYASVECGAKILSANNEAKSTSAILRENMDLYMLNPCSTKIWFVIELCEPIQVKQLDIANFELFSSTPKDFLVSISDRYPTNKWVKLGTFHAHDERIVQSFPLDEQLYAKYVKMFIKYIKVELLSHFGSEHFCPLSLIRVFGTSMVEEYEAIAESQYPAERLEFLEDDYDYPAGYQPGEQKASENLLGSATNAIVDIVNKFANVLGGNPKLEGGAETGDNATEEESDEMRSTYTKDDQTEESTQSVVLESQSAADMKSNTSTDSALSSPLTEDDRQIVMLVQEEEDEEPEQSTVTLLEEEEEEGKDEKTKKEADRNQWESQAYCPYSSFSTLSLSCMATLPELLHRWCSARLTKERLRSLRRRHFTSKTHTPPDDGSPVSPHIVPPPIPTPTPAQEVLPFTETPPELGGAVKHDNEGTPEEVPTSSTQPDPHTPDLHILLEPSRTATIPPHSFSDIHSSLSRPTPTNEEKGSLLVDDTADPLPTPPLQAASIPETQHASSSTPTPSLSLPLRTLSSETASSEAMVPPVKEQPVLSLPTVSRPDNLRVPPTELPAAVPPADSHTDKVKPGPETGEKSKLNFDALQVQGEQGSPPPQAGEYGVLEELLNANGNTQRSTTDFYAELQNGSDYSGAAVNSNGVLLNGGAVHGSNQKESVFMRLNNRIKALEMNMSLSSRYLEELSQRYRKQMEEMQKAFNKTIIKLQNTSRIAEEQDQKQTESIQMLQSQLENVTKLIFNLTATVSHLQQEVSDRQGYLVVSLVLCLLLGVLLCLQCCRSSSPSQSTNTAALPKSNHYPSPKRCFSSYDDMSLKRRVTCPLVRSKSFQLSSPEVGPDDLYIVEPLKFSPEKKKKRGKTKSLDKVETLKAFAPSAPLTTEDPNCKSLHSSTLTPLPPPPLLPPPPPPPPPLPPPSPVPSTNLTSALPPCTFEEFVSETSSSTSSSHSEESYSSHLPPPAPILPSHGLCNGHSVSFPIGQPPKFRQEKRSVKRRKSRQSELQFPAMPDGGIGSLPSLQELMKGSKEMSVRTIAVTGHV